MDQTNHTRTSRATATTGRRRTRTTICFDEFVAVHLVSYLTQEPHQPDNENDNDEETSSTCDVGAGGENNNEDADNLCPRGSDLWYTREQVREMGLRDRKLLSLLLAAEDETTNSKSSSFLKTNSRFGLETKRQKVQRRKNTRDAVTAVLLEQARLEQDAKDSDLRIQRAYQAATEESRDQALDRGIKLAIALTREDVERLHHSFASTSSTESLMESSSTCCPKTPSNSTPTSVAASPTSSLATTTSGIFFLGTHYSFSDHEKEDSSFTGRKNARWNAQPEVFLSPRTIATGMNSPPFTSDPNSTSSSPAEMLPTLPIRR